MPAISALKLKQLVDIVQKVRQADVSLNLCRAPRSIGRSIGARLAVGLARIARAADSVCRDPTVGAISGASGCSEGIVAQIGFGVPRGGAHRQILLQHTANLLRLEGFSHIALGAIRDELRDARLAAFG